MSIIDFLIYILRRIFFQIPSNYGVTDVFLLNRDRRRNHLDHYFQDDLSYVARKHSKDMAKRLFEHENKLGYNHADRYKIERITEVTSGEI